MSGKDKNPQDASPANVSRRAFLKVAGAGAAIIPTLPAAVVAAQPAATPAAQSANAAFDRQALISAIGETIIPDDPGDPGYKSLEPFNITDEVMKGLGDLSDDDLALFDTSAATVLGDKTFLEMSEAQRTDYLNLIIDGRKIGDKNLQDKLHNVYRVTRQQVMMVYYRNYPEHLIPRDENDVPILPIGDTHQITNPNTNRIFTGWDRAGYHGPLTWEEEERRRNIIKKLDWKE